MYSLINEVCEVQRHKGIMAEQWLKALRAADTFLCQIQRLACARSAEDKQLLQLSNHFKKLKSIDCEDNVLLTQAVNALKHFSQESRDKLLEMIVDGMDKVDTKPAPKKKSCLQDYTNLCHVIPQRVWNLILDDSRTTADTLECVVMWAGALGLKHPSEPTMGGLVALAFWRSWSVKPVSNCHKHYAYTLGKKVIREMLARFDISDERLLVLPQRFEELPMSLQQVFGDEILGLFFIEN